MARRPCGVSSLRRGTPPVARRPVPRCPALSRPRAEPPPVSSRALYRSASPMTSAAERQGRSRDGSTST